MERLSHIIEDKCQPGCWKVVQVGKGGPRISSLMFADHVVLFARATKDQTSVIKHYLNKFCIALGKRLSAKKSNINFLANKKESIITEVCNTLGMSRTENFAKYPGVATNNGRVSKATCQDVIARVYRKLASWKAKCLSLARRTMLI